MERKRFVLDIAHSETADRRDQKSRGILPVPRFKHEVEHYLLERTLP